VRTIDQKARLPRRLGLVAGFAALAALPAVGLAAYAEADTTGTGAAPSVGRVVRAPLSDEQRQCLADHGVTLPQRPPDPESGERPAPPTDAQREAFRVAAADCGLPTPPAGVRGPRPQLSDEERQCLADHGVNLPERPADPASGERPAPPTDEQRTALRAAAQECNLPVPAHGPRPGGFGPGAGFGADGGTTNVPRETAV
jgi:hypothetical protein